MTGGESELALEAKSGIRGIFCTILLVMMFLGKRKRKISTWFGSIQVSGRHLLIFIDGYSDCDEVIEFEDEIADVANTHLHLAVSLNSGRFGYRRFDNFEGGFEFLNSEQSTSQIPKFLIATSRNMYIVKKDSSGTSSQLLKVIDDMEPSGILNPPTSIQFPWPVRILDGDAGHDFMVLRDSTGNLFAMGTGTRGELGVGLIRRVDEPVHIEQLAGIRIAKVKCGGWHTVALTEHGDTYTWGWNRNGQLGKDKMITEVYPVLIDPEAEFSNSEQDVSDVDTTENTTIITLKTSSTGNSENAETTKEVTNRLVLGTDTSTIADFQID